MSLASTARRGEQPPAPTSAEFISRLELPRRVVPTLLFFGSAVLYFLTSARGHAQINLDVWTANYESWHVVTTGHPWIDGLRIPHLCNNPIQGVWIRHAINGHTVIGALPASWL